MIPASVFQEQSVTGKVPDFTGSKREEGGGKREIHKVSSLY